MSHKVIRARAQDLLDVRNLSIPNSPHKLPAKATYYKIWNCIPQRERDLAKYGYSRTRSLYRWTEGHDDPKAAFEVVEYDEGLLPFYFFDERLQIPLGRAWLTLFVDVFSRSIIGFYLGFEPPGDVPATAALRHSCLLKSYVRREYSCIRNDYLQGGVGRLYRVDNGRAQWGNTLENCALELDSDILFTPVRTPWYKSTVEGMLKYINEQLLKELPGFWLGQGKLDAADYNWRENACLGIRAFLVIFHKWLIDVYHVDRQKKLGASPNERYIEGTSIIEPGLVPRAADLDLLFGVIRTARLDHRGVVFEGIRYGGDALKFLRHSIGHTISKSKGGVRISINPTNLFKIGVWDPKAEIWIPAFAINAEYAMDLSLHRHLVHRNAALARGWDGDDNECLIVQRELQDLIVDQIQDAKGISQSSRIGRYFGIGTETLFRGIDHDGSLAPLTSLV